jgi:hypothetical protein
MEEILAAKKRERERLRNLPFEEKIKIVEEMNKFLAPLYARLDRDNWDMPRRALERGVRRHRSELRDFKWCYLFPETGRKFHFNTKEEGDAILDRELRDE